MKLRTLISAVALTAAMCLTVPAAAETFTAANGVVSIDLPTENWKEMNDPAKWIVLSDGASTITIEHFANGEKLPEISIANDHYVNVYQAVFSTQNEVFIVTGSVINAADIPDICNSIMSVKVLKYNTKQAVRTQAPKASDFSVSPMDAIYYVTSNGLNVRSGCSTNEAVLGGFGYGASVHVIGNVLQNGADLGWFQVEYNGGTGYVASNFLSAEKPAVKEEPKAEQKKEEAPSYFTGNARTLYDANGNAVTVYEATDGLWYNTYGTYFYATVEGEYAGSDGSTLTVNQPVSGPTFTGYTHTIYFVNGNAITVKEFSNGSFYSDDWTEYVYFNQGVWLASDGSILYDFEPHLGNGNPGESHYLYQPETGKTTQVFSYGADFVDLSYMLYTKLDNGEFVDYFGNHYVVRGE